jgi:hypothetical protein
MVINHISGYDEHTDKNAENLQGKNKVWKTFPVRKI